MSISRAFKNTVSLFSAKLFSSLLSFLVVFVAARSDVFLLGKFSLGFAYFIIFTEIPLLGLNIFLIREVAKKENALKSFFLIGNVLSYISVLPLVIILLFLIIYGGYPKDLSLALFWVMLAVFPSGFIAVSQTFFVAFEKIKRVSFTIIFENVLRSSTALWILLRGGNLAQIFFLFFILRLLSLALNFILLKKDKLLPATLTWDKTLFYFTIRNWPVFLGIYVFGILMSKIDYVLLSKLGTIKDVGFYSASYKLLDMLLMIPTSFIFSFFPLFSKMNMSAADKNTVTLLLKYFSMLAMPIVAAFFFLSRDILGLLYGKLFVDSAIVLSILIWGFLITGCDQVLGILLISQGRQSTDLKILSVSLVFYLLSLFLLIPRFGYIGAGIATIISNLLLLILKIIYLQKSELRMSFTLFNKNIFFALILFAFTFVLRQYLSLSSILALVIFTILYGAGIFIFKIVLPSERHYILQSSFKLLDFRKNL